MVVAVDETSGSGHVTLKIYREKSSSMSCYCLRNQPFFGSKDISSKPSTHLDSSSYERYESCGQRNDNVPGTRAQETRLRRKKSEETKGILRWGRWHKNTYLLKKTKKKLRQVLAVTMSMKRLNLHPRGKRGHDLVRGRNGYRGWMNGLGRGVKYGGVLGCIDSGVLGDIEPQPLHKALPRHFRGRFSGPCAVQPRALYSSRETVVREPNPHCGTKRSHLMYSFAIVSEWKAYALGARTWDNININNHWIAVWPHLKLWDCVIRVKPLLNFGIVFFTLNRSSSHLRPTHPREIQALWSQATTQEIYIVIQLQYSYDKRIRQRTAMPPYWILQALNTHDSNLNTLREIKRKKTNQNKTCVLKENLQWPCSSFGIDLKDSREFHSAICGAILQIFNLKENLQCTCTTP